jgi:hypothetical protein
MSADPSSASIQRARLAARRDQTRAAYIELARSIEPQYANTFTFNRAVNSITGQQRIKGFINSLEREVLGRRWSVFPAHMRITAVGFLEHADTNAHWHTVMQIPLHFRKILRTHGEAAWRDLVPQGELDIEWIGSKKKWSRYITKELYDLIGKKDARPTRYVIDFQGKTVIEAQQYGELFTRVQKAVLPAREKAAKVEEGRNKKTKAADSGARVNIHHANFLRRWWIMSYPREDMVRAIERLSRYIVCGQVTKRPVFEFVCPDIRPNAACMVFPYDDDYSFGILQSAIHWVWFINRCSTLTERFRYTSNTVFDTFPWPQNPSEDAIGLETRDRASTRPTKHH